MRSSEHDLVALVGSRICHDLINPLGAVGNGLELMQQAGQGGSPEFGLVSDSLSRAAGRIRFFRIAFGLAQPGAVLSRRVIAGAIDECYRGGRLSVVWRPAAEVPRQQAKLAFLGLLCLETALPHGGEIAIECRGLDWHLTAQGPRVIAGTPAWAHLEDPRAGFDASPADVQFVLLAGEIAEAGRHLSVERAADSLSMTF